MRRWLKGLRTDLGKGWRYYRDSRKLRRDIARINGSGEAT